MSCAVQDGWSLSEATEVKLGKGATSRRTDTEWCSMATGRLDM